MREDDIRRPDGSRGIYSVIDKPTYALVIARDGDRFRLVEQYRYPLGLRRWEFPQGTAPDLETAEPLELAARELREETGLRADAMALLGQLDVAPGMSSQRGWVFLATGITEGEHDVSTRNRTCTATGSAARAGRADDRDGEITDAQSSRRLRCSCCPSASRRTKQLRFLCLLVPDKPRIRLTIDHYTCKIVITPDKSGTRAVNIDFRHPINQCQRLCMINQA